MALTYLEQLMGEFPDSADSLKNCKELYQKKLWHQLTDELDKLIVSESCDIDFIRFEAKFIRDFRKYMNTLRYGSMIVEIASRCYDQEIITEIQGIAFCEQALCCIESDENESQKQHFDDKKVDNTQTKLLIETQIAFFELNRNSTNGDSLNIAKTKLDDIEARINASIRACPPLIYSRFHYVFCKLWSSQQNRNDLASDISWTAMFYKHAMSYLGYTAFHQIKDPTQWANDIALAALVAPDFYDFGELSLHPIIKSLQNSPQQWVLDVVTAYISSDIDSYNHVIAKYKDNIEKNNVLQNAKPKDILNEKIKLLSLVHLAFHKASFERIISFEEIQNVTQCDSDSVEHLIMKAMSLELIKGIVDEIDKTVQIQWVKPAILDKTQIHGINEKINVWINKIQQTQKEIVPSTNISSQ